MKKNLQICPLFLILIFLITLSFSSCNLLFGDSQIDNTGELGAFFSATQLVTTATLRKDISGISIYEVKEDSSLVLDLNGHTLTSTSPFHNNAVILIKGTFTLKDSGTGGTVKNEGKNRAVIEVMQTGTLYIQQSIYDSIGSKNIVINDGAKLSIFEE